MSFARNILLQASLDLLLSVAAPGWSVTNATLQKLLNPVTLWDRFFASMLRRSAKEDRVMSISRFMKSHALITSTFLLALIVPANAQGIPGGVVHGAYEGNPLQGLLVGLSGV